MKSLSLLRQQVSSGYADDYVGEYKESPMFKQFFRAFKKEFTALATSLGCTNVQFSKHNYFDMSGFYTMPNGQMAYISFNDWRFGAHFMTRTSPSYKSYSSGHGPNVTLCYETDADFEDCLQRFIRSYDKKLTQPVVPTKTEPTLEEQLAIIEQMFRVA